MMCDQLRVILEPHLGSSSVELFQVMKEVDNLCRQQIGRELLYEFRCHHLGLVRQRIREVCKLEKDKWN